MRCWGRMGKNSGNDSRSGWRRTHQTVHLREIHRLLAMKDKNTPEELQGDMFPDKGFFGSALKAAILQSIKLFEANANLACSALKS